MNTLSEILAVLFESLGLYTTSNGLGDHLRGLDVSCNENTGQSIYNIIFLSLATVNSLLMYNYYYGLFDRANFTNIWTWLANALAGAAILFAIAYLYSSSGSHCSQLTISNSDYFGFGVVASIFSLLWSLMFSFMIKWKSDNNKKVPF